MSEKIQKILANAGIGSRRQIETWIKEKRISINGCLAKIGDRLQGQERIWVNGHEVKLIKTQRPTTRVLLYHKPAGEICSRTDPKGRATVFDTLPLLRNSRWISIGRLDFNTSGLLLFTNNGELAHRLMHPSSAIEREYAVRVRGTIPSALLQKLRKGVSLEDGFAHFNHISYTGGEGSNHWYQVMVKEGRNRLVRRLLESQNIAVSRLLRTRFGPCLLPRLISRGKWQELGQMDIQKLQDSFQLKE